MRHPSTPTRRRLLCATVAAAATLFVAPEALAAQCEPGTVVGTVTHVRDGDTIEVGGLPIRLEGLAAPERDEPGGMRATGRCDRWSTGASCDAS